MRTFLLFISTLFISLLAIAQNRQTTIDSLQDALDGKDTTFIWANINRLLDVRVEADDPLIVLKADSSSPYFCAVVYQFNGVQYQQRNRMEEAVSSFSKARSYFKRALDNGAFHYTGFLLAHAQSRLGIFDQSSAYLIPALDYFKKLKDTSNVLPILQSLCYAYYMGKDIEKENVYRKEQLQWSSNEAYCDVRLEALRTLSRWYRERGKLDSSIYTLGQLKAEILDCRLVDSNDMLGMAYVELAQVQVIMDSTFDSDPLLLLAFKKFEASQNPYWCGFVYSIRAGDHFRKGDFGKAATIADSGYAYSLTHGLVKEKRDNLKVMYEANAALGRYQQAFEALLSYMRVQQEMDPGEGNVHMKEEEMKLKAEKDRLLLLIENERVLAKERNIRNVYLGAGFLVLLSSIGLWSRLRFTRRAKKEIELEKERSENLLLNILPEEIAQELKEKGRADARDFEMVSILFTDFKGFTSLSEQMSAQDLVANINDRFEAFDKICEQYGVEKIKTIGDAYMAAGGLPIPSDDSVRITIMAALEMQAFIEGLHKKNESEGRHGFEMRVGIHTGPVVAGIVGVKKFQYDIWGDTVNTASRMESNGEVGKVNISQATYELIKDDPQFTFEHRGKIEAKGKGEVDMYFVSLA